ncbi:uncharacterized protein TrAtP1_006252 [Trichoderma atroviride]|uniref:uncharacterized protein n=1 Tax=Hypocrea atroviridis TaxID=63577 RepID=UPI003326630A|nr:hypothetical protein TrAtP1_006252 [Trichoderma atroviride]
MEHHHPQQEQRRACLVSELQSNVKQPVRVRTSKYMRIKNWRHQVQGSHSLRCLFYTLNMASPCCKTGASLFVHAPQVLDMESFLFGPSTEY